MAENAASILAQPQIKDMLSNMAPHERDRWLQDLSRDYPGETAIINEQLGYSDELRRTADAEGRETGGVYVAANPLEHLNTGLSRMKGEKERKEARAGAKDLSDTKSSALERLMRGVSGADGIAEDERLNALPSPRSKPILESNLAQKANDDMGLTNTGVGNLIPGSTERPAAGPYPGLRAGPITEDTAYKQRREESDTFGPLIPFGRNKNSIYGDTLRKKRRQGP